MALDDPYNPYGPTLWDDEREQAFRAAMGAAYIPTATPLPAPPSETPAPLKQPPPGEAGVIDYGSPSESGRGQPMFPIDPETGEVRDPRDVFKPPPVPRDDSARIAGLGGPTVAEEVARRPEQELPPYAVASDVPTVSLPSGGFVGAAPVPGERPIEETQDPVAQAQAWARLAQEDPEAYAAAMQRHAVAEQSRRMEGEEKIVRADWERAKATRENTEQAFARAKQMQAQIDTDAAALAKQKIDPNRGWSSKSTAQKIAGFLAAVVGGLVQGRVGGRNAGLDMINQEIDRDIEVQKQNITNAGANLGRQQGLVAQLYAQTGDLDRAAETARRAAKEQSLQELEIEMMKFDPNGATARQIGQQIVQGRAQLASEKQKRAERQVDRDIKAGEYGLKVRGQQLQEEKFLADERRRAAAASKQKEIKLEDIPLQPEQLRSLGIAIPENTSMPPLTIGQARKIAETAKSVQDWQKAARENSPQERARQFGVGELVDTGGNALQFRSVEGAEKVGKLKGAADFGVQLLDRMIAARETYGWSSDLLKSPEWREMQADFAQYALEKKNIDELGVLAGPDLGLIHKAAGTGDPTELRDPTPGLKRARENIIEKTNSTVRAQVAPGVTPKRWEPPKPRPPAPLSPEQEQIKQLIKFNPKRPTREETGGKVQVEDFLPPQYAKRIDRLVAVFNDPDATPEAQRDAGALLEEIKKNATSGIVRDYATAAAVREGITGIPASEDIGPATQTAREKAPR